MRQVTLKEGIESGRKVQIGLSGFAQDGTVTNSAVHTDDETFTILVRFPGGYEVTRTLHGGYAVCGIEE